MHMTIRDLAETEHALDCMHECTTELPGLERFDHVHTCEACQEDATRRVHTALAAQ